MHDNAIHVVSLFKSINGLVLKINVSLINNTYIYLSLNLSSYTFIGLAPTHPDPVPTNCASLYS